MEINQTTGYPSIDKPWLKYYPKDADKIEPINLTYYEYYIKANNKYLNKPGIEYYKNVISRYDVIKNSDIAAKILNYLGVKKREQVLFGMIGIPEAFYIIMGLSKIGAGANIVNITYEKDLLIDSILNSKFKVIFILDVFYDYFEETLKMPEMSNKKIVVVHFSESFPKFIRLITFKQRFDLKKKFDCLAKTYGLDISYYDDLIKKSNSMHDVEIAKYDKKLKFLTVYSSGTTSKAKGIDLSVDSIIYMARNHELADLGTDENTASLHKVPICFSTGINNNFLLPPLVGMINVLDPVFDKKTIGKSFLQHRFKIGVAILSNEMWEAVSNSKLKKDTLSNLTHPIAGGDGASIYRQLEIFERLKKFGCKIPLYSGAGCTEVGACATTILRQAYKAGTAGVPLPQVNVAVIDETGEQLKYNQSGELCYSTPMMMLGYTNNINATRNSFIYINSEKYYKTGDIGFVDEDGFVTYRGRKSDFIVINDNGIEKKQYLFEVEEIVKKYKSVIDCEALGINLNDNKYKNVIVHIQFNSQNTDFIKKTVVEIYNDFKSILPLQSVPVAIKIRKDFPVAKSGKRDVKKLLSETDNFLYVKDNNVYDCSLKDL